ncbi:10578_t:CDS:2, partial [Racocetra persica]
ENNKCVRDITFDSKGKISYRGNVNKGKEKRVNVDDKETWKSGLEKSKNCETTSKINMRTLSTKINSLKISKKIALIKKAKKSLKKSLKKIYVYFLLGDHILTKHPDRRNCLKKFNFTVYKNVATIYDLTRVHFLELPFQHSFFDGKHHKRETIISLINWFKYYIECDDIEFAKINENNTVTTEDQGIDSIDHEDQGIDSIDHEDQVCISGDDDDVQAAEARNC